MARNDGRIEPGQKLAGAISARAWNRAQDAADRVLGAGTGFSAKGPSLLHLPCVKGTFPEYNWHIPFGTVCTIRAFAFPDEIAEVSTAVTWVPGVGEVPAWADVEKKMPGVSAALLEVERSSPMPVDGLYEHNNFVVNIDSGSTFAISGCAIARVRVFNYVHRYARLPLAHPSIDNSPAVGALDSCFFGSAKILGYIAESTEDHVPQLAPVGDAIIASPLAIQTNLVYPEFKMHWAVIQF